MTGLTGWDWFVLGVMLISTLAGLWRGLVRMVFALLGWIAAVLGAPLGAPAVIGAIGMHAHPWVVLVGLFVAILLGMRLLGTLLARGLRGVGLGGADRLAGGVLGVLRALLVVAVAAMIGKLAGQQAQPAWRQALVRPLLDACVDVIESRLPEGLTGVQHT